jgi:hypothetical protein
MLKNHFSYNDLLGKDMVDATVNVFLEKLLSGLPKESRILSLFRDQFKRLQRDLLLMQSFLKMLIGSLGRAIFFVRCEN